MIALMNYAVPLIFIVSVFLSIRFKRWSPLVVGFVFALIYTIAQPTYLPKGTVPELKIQETVFVDKPIVDRGMKPKSDAERDAARNAELKRINESIESKINKEQ